MENKYLNEAIIGNKHMTVSFSKKGELLRLYYPNPDFKQYIDKMEMGVKINDSGLIRLEEDINNVYHQSFTKDTNILNTEITNTYFNLKVLQTDFVPIKHNVLVKRYVFTNISKIDLQVSFLIHSKLLSDNNNFVSGKVVKYGLVQYTHDASVAIISKNTPVTSHRIHDSNQTINTGVIEDKDYIGMTADSSVCYDLGYIQPEEQKVLEISILIHENNDKTKPEEITEEIEKIQKINYEKEEEATKKYWNKYVKEHSKLELKETTAYEKKIKNIYHRTILLYPLLTNEQTGGIAAAVEVDEKFTQCGRYAYCWPRDAVFITEALDKLGMEKETEKFYKTFCKNTQNKNGMWEQRFYTDGKLAPCWGYQIDETASVVCGVYAHYQQTKEEKFLKETFKMCEKAVHFLQRYIAQILQLKEEKDIVKKELQEKYKEKIEKLPVSYDLWEMHEGIHLYSLAAIFKAFESMYEIYQIIEKCQEKENPGIRLKQENMAKNKRILEEQMQVIKKYTLEKFYHQERKTLVRNLSDRKMDISILGVVVPFGMFSPKEKKIMNTMETINLTLRTYTGGYIRFEEDHYRKGNPWPIATLWMALYYLEIGQKKKAKECFEFVVHSSTEHGYLAEQVDNEKMEASWVIGLRMVTCNVYPCIR